MTDLHEPFELGAVTGTQAQHGLIGGGSPCRIEIDEGAVLVEEDALERHAVMAHGRFFLKITGASCAGAALRAKPRMRGRARAALPFALPQKRRHSIWQGHDAPHPLGLRSARPPSRAGPVLARPPRGDARRIEPVNPAVNAVIAVEPDLARQAAENPTGASPPASRPLEGS